MFFLVPLLNPDGVFNGYHRYDSLGNNLNRCYKQPNPEETPTIYAFKQLISYFSSQIYSFVDLHAHATVKGIFLYGNH